MTRNQPATPPAAPAPTILVTDRFMYRTGGAASGVGGGLDDGLTAFTIWAAEGIVKLFGDATSDAVVMIDAYAAAKLGLPIRIEALGDDTSGHPIVLELQSAGWRVNSLRPWMTLYADDRPTLHVGILPWTTRADCPMLGFNSKNPGRVFDLGHVEIVAAFDAWERLIGTPYSGTPGAAGTTAVRSLATSGRKAYEPTWRPKVKGPEGAYEMAYRLPHENDLWPAFAKTIEETPEDHAWWHGYDAKRAYLAAFNVVQLCPWGLKNTRAEYSDNLAGWWLAEFEPWTDERLPDPVGYPKSHNEEQPKWATDSGKTVRWVTGPTMDLLTQLRDEGLHGGYKVYDAWTGPAVRVLRPVYERFKAAWLAPEVQPDPARPDWRVNQVVQATYKRLYSETYGMFNHPGSHVERPDWHYAIVAQFRANLWRKMRNVGEESGRYPVSIDVDNIYYSSADADAVASLPGGIVLGDGLGQFSVKRSKQVREVKV
jgi:hypothetical protein